jgi:hydroxyacylglutathione hydrolase
MIIDVITSGPIDTNAYLVGCPKTKKAVVIDAPSEATPVLLKRAAHYGITIEKILLTQSHWDHIADVFPLKQKTSASVYVHPEDAANLKNPGADNLPLYFKIVGVEPDGELIEGNEVSVGDLTFKVIHTPGHTPGCVCLYIEDQGVLFSGDTLFKGGMGNLNLPTARRTLMKGSLNKLAKLPKDTKVYPGHGEPTTIQNEQWI